jgi:4-aminobutyrate aminotransferase-like enzyme
MDFSDFHFPEAPKIVVTPPGPKSGEATAMQAIHESNVVSYSKAIPIGFEEWKGGTIEGMDGNVYVDFFGAGGLELISFPKTESIEDY